MSAAYRGPFGAPAVVVSGMVAGTPRHGGATWAVIQYLLGLRSLGCDVTFGEPLDAAPRDAQLRYCADVISQFGFGERWATLPSVVLAEWPVARAVEHDAFTSVANWRGYGSIEHRGVTYGQKAQSLRPMADLPQRVDERFLLALAIHPDESADAALLQRSGWQLVDPDAVAGSADDHRRFVQGSRGEFGISNSGYVLSRSGWFSDRSACYLASGRPVLAQDTAFGRRLPTGRGLFSFADADDVVAALADVRCDPDGHREAARAVAELHLDSHRVLTSLLESTPT